MTLDASKFRFRLVTAESEQQGVVLMCLACGEPAYGDPILDPIGQSHGGAEPDDDLDTVLFQADEHQTMYCKGPA